MKIKIRLLAFAISIGLVLAAWSVVTYGLFFAHYKILFLLAGQILVMFASVTLILPMLIQKKE